MKKLVYSSLLVPLGALLISSGFTGASWIVPMAFESECNVSSVLTTSIFIFQGNQALCRIMKAIVAIFAATGFAAVLL